MDDKTTVATKVKTTVAASTKITLGVTLVAGVITAAVIILALTNIK